MLHFNRARDNYADIQQFVIDESIFSDKEKIKTIDAFVFRFIKLQDFMSEKLFRRLLEAVGEYKDSMSLFDVLDKMEKLGLVASADEWIRYRKLRNQLTHEYPDNQQDLLAGIKLALVYFNKMGDLLQTIIEYSEEHQLTH